MTQDRREELYVALAIYDETLIGKGVREGPVAALMQFGGMQMMQPLFTTDPAGLQQMLEIGPSLAKRDGRRIVVARFSQREDIEVFDP